MAQNQGPSSLSLFQPGSPPALGCQRDDAKGNDTNAVNNRRDMQADRRRRESCGHRRETERQVGDHESDGQELAPFAGRGQTGQRPK